MTINPKTRTVSCDECGYIWVTGMLMFGDDRCPRCNHLQAAAQGLLEQKIDRLTRELTETKNKLWAAQRRVAELERLHGKEEAKAQEDRGRGSPLLDLQAPKGPKV